MKVLQLAVIGALFASLLLLSVITVSPALAQYPEDDPDCPLEPPQSEQIDTDPVDAEGSTGEADDPGALKPVESEIEGPGPTFIDPVPLGSGGGSAPDFEKADIPMRWQDPNDVSCGVQALGMAIDGLGGDSPTSAAILEHLQSNGMMYEFGTGVEELAFTAQNFGYKGTKPFHNWTLEDLQGELSEGRAPVVALGANGEGQPGHFVTVTGVSPDGKWVSYNDPTLGEQTITTEEFERLWGLQGNSGVAVRKTVPAGEENVLPWVAIAATLMAIISQTPLALRRMGIGGALNRGAGIGTRKKSETKQGSSARSLGSVPNLAAKAASKVKAQVAVRTPPSPPRDPSPQMYNRSLAPAPTAEKPIRREPEPEPADEELPWWKRAAVGIADGWNRAVTGAQGLLGIGGHALNQAVDAGKSLLERAWDGARNLANLIAVTQQLRVEAESFQATWMHDYVLRTQRPGLPADGPITPALVNMSRIDAGGNPISPVGADLAAIIQGREVEVSFLGTGAGAAPWTGRIIVPENYVDPTNMETPGGTALVGHELEHVLQRDLDDNNYFPAGSLRFTGPHRWVAGDSTNYMEVLAYIVGDAIEYDLLVHKRATSGLTISETRRLATLQDTLATLTDADALNATRFIVQKHQNMSVYMQNYVVEQNVADHRIPDGGWEHWLREMGFGDDAIAQIKYTASLGTFEYIDPNLIDPNTGIYSTATPTPTPSSTPTPSPSPTSSPTATPTNSPTSSPSPMNTPPPTP